MYGDHNHGPYQLADYALDMDDDLSDVVPTAKFWHDFPDGVVPIKHTDHLIRDWHNFLDPYQTLHDTLSVFEYELEEERRPLTWLRQGWYRCRTACGNGEGYDARGMVRQVMFDHLRLYSLRDLARAMDMSLMSLVYEFFGSREAVKRVDWRQVSDLVEQGVSEKVIRDVTGIAYQTLNSYKKLRGMRTASDALTAGIRECINKGYNNKETMLACDQLAIEAGLMPTSIRSRRQRMMDAPRRK